MTTYIVRVWMPDRPGALGQVASRIGAVRGDLVGIDILERGGGRAIDELVVELPSPELVPLLVKEVDEVDGVDVEDVRPATEQLRDARLDALETAALLVEQGTRAGLVSALVLHAAHDFEADWAVVLEQSSVLPVAGVGNPPPAPWLTAYAAGSRSSTLVASGETGPDDVAAVDLRPGGPTLVLGRQGRPFRARERRQLGALARVADARWSELAERESRRAHPSALGEVV